MKSIKELFENYDLYIEAIRANRKGVVSRQARNRTLRQELNQVKKELLEQTNAAIKDGKTLYQICMENFGKIDHRFYALFQMKRSRKQKKS